MESSICRVCLEKMGSVSIFDTEGDNIKYSAKIMRCVGLVIDENDELPKNICGTCVWELSLAYQFVLKCEASDKTLRCLKTPDLDLESKDLDIKGEFIKHQFHDDIFDNNFLLDTSQYSDPECESKIIRESEDVKNECKEGKKKKNRLGPMQCVRCGLLAKSPSALDTHMRIHTGEKPFQCSSCDTKFSTKGGLKRHTETFHTQRVRTFMCETCGNSFFRKNDIIAHIRVHTGEKPYVCSFCSKRFGQITSLRRHQRTHTGEKPYACPICDKKFADKNLVKKHQYVHSDEKHFSCLLCNKSVKTKTALNVHMNLHKNEKKNICSFCGMAFSVKGNLQTHIRRIHSEKSGQCSVCLKTFPDLEVHMRKHTGEKPFVCTVCNAAFSAKRSLAHHILFKHENASKFRCSIGDCSKTFPTVTMLEFHLLKQHTNHTPYVCQHCSRGFFRTSDLSRHLRVSHMDIPIKGSLKTLIQ